MLQHQARRTLHAVTLRDRDDAGSHRSIHTSTTQSASMLANITFGQNPDESTIVDYRQSPETAGVHQALRRLKSLAGAHGE